MIPLSAPGESGFTGAVVCEVAGVTTGFSGGSFSRREGVFLRKFPVTFPSIFPAGASFLCGCGGSGFFGGKNGFLVGGTGCVPIGFCPCCVGGGVCRDGCSCCGFGAGCHPSFEIALISESSWSKKSDIKKDKNRKGIEPEKDIKEN